MFLAKNGHPEEHIPEPTDEEIEAFDELIPRTMLPYALIASVEESADLISIGDFVEAIVELLNKKFRRLEGMFTIKDHSSVKIVFHILPHVDSREYRSMKRLSRDRGIIAQGILHDSTVNWFAQVGGLGFAVRKITKSVCDQTARVFGQRKFDEPSAGPAIEDHSRKDRRFVDEITDGSRHQESGEITMVVDGISHHVKPAKLFAVLLSPIRVLQVKWHYTVVHVTFANKQEALQACEKIGRVMSDKYPLTIRSLKGDVEREGIM
ncbi:unnamed protein product, partial [Mesorhabditis spiculigera]